MPVVDLDAAAWISPAGTASAAPISGCLPTAIIFPLNIRFGGLLDRRLSFRNPLQVRLYKSSGSYVAECSQLDQFGYGSNSAEALDDLGQTLSEMYFYLTDAQQSGTLGESLSRQFDTLCGFIGRAVTNH